MMAWGSHNTIFRTTLGSFPSWRDSWRSATRLFYRRADLERDDRQSNDLQPNEKESLTTPLGSKLLGEFLPLLSHFFEAAERPRHVCRPLRNVPRQSRY